MSTAETLSLPYHCLLCLKVDILNFVQKLVLQVLSQKSTVVQLADNLCLATYAALE